MAKKEKTPLELNTESVDGSYRYLESVFRGLLSTGHISKGMHDVLFDKIQIIKNKTLIKDYLE